MKKAKKLTTVQTLLFSAGLFLFGLIIWFVLARSNSASSPSTMDMAAMEVFGFNFDLISAVCVVVAAFIFLFSTLVPTQKTTPTIFLAWLALVGGLLANTGWAILFFYWVSTLTVFFSFWQSGDEVGRDEQWTQDLVLFLRDHGLGVVFQILGLLMMSAQRENSGLYALGLGVFFSLRVVPGMSPLPKHEGFLSGGEFSFSHFMISLFPVLLFFRAVVQVHEIESLSIMAGVGFFLSGIYLISCFVRERLSEIFILWTRAFFVFIFSLECLRLSYPALSIFLGGLFGFTGILLLLLAGFSRSSKRIISMLIFYLASALGLPAFVSAGGVVQLFSVFSDQVGAQLSIVVVWGLFCAVGIRFFYLFKNPAQKAEATPLRAWVDFPAMLMLVFASLGIFWTGRLSGGWIRAEEPMLFDGIIQGLFESVFQDATPWGAIAICMGAYILGGLLFVLTLKIKKGRVKNFLIRLPEYRVQVLWGERLLANFFKWIRFDFEWRGSLNWGKSVMPMLNKIEWFFEETFFVPASRGLDMGIRRISAGIHGRIQGYIIFGVAVSVVMILYFVNWG